MNLLILCHPNMALTDNWCYRPDEGREYYQKSLRSINDYDITIVPFLKSYENKFKSEHDQYVSEVTEIATHCGWELKVGDIMISVLDEILLSGEVSHIEFGGGYASDCLATTLRRFFEEYGTYISEQRITWSLNADLVYYPPISDRVVEFNDLQYLSGSLNFQDVHVRGEYSEYDPSIRYTL